MARFWQKVCGVEGPFEHLWIHHSCWWHNPHHLHLLCEFDEGTAGNTTWPFSWRTSEPSRNFRAPSIVLGRIQTVPSGPWSIPGALLQSAISYPHCLARGWRPRQAPRKHLCSLPGSLRWAGDRCGDEEKTQKGWVWRQLQMQPASLDETEVQPSRQEAWWSHAVRLECPVDQPEASFIYATLVPVHLAIFGASWASWCAAGAFGSDVQGLEAALLWRDHCCHPPWPQAFLFCNHSCKGGLEVVLQGCLGAIFPEPRPGEGHWLLSWMPSRRRRFDLGVHGRAACLGSFAFLSATMDTTTSNDCDSFYKACPWEDLQTGHVSLCQNGPIQRPRWKFDHLAMREGLLWQRWHLSQTGRLSWHVQALVLRYQTHCKFAQLFARFPDVPKAFSFPLGKRQRFRCDLAAEIPQRAVDWIYQFTTGPRACSTAGFDEAGLRSSCGILTHFDWPWALVSPTVRHDGKASPQEVHSWLHDLGQWHAEWSLERVGSKTKTAPTQACRAWVTWMASWWPWILAEFQLPWLWDERGLHRKSLPAITPAGQPQDWWESFEKLPDQVTCALQTVSQAALAERFELRWKTNLDQKWGWVLLRILWCFYDVSSLCSNWSKCFFPGWAAAGMQARTMDTIRKTLSSNIFHIER